MKRNHRAIGFIAAFSCGGAAALVAIMVYAHVFVVRKAQVSDCYGTVGTIRWLEGSTQSQRDIFLNYSNNEKISATKHRLWDLAEMDMNSKDDLLRDYFEGCINGKADWDN
jgi:hypothetical protein